MTFHTIYDKVRLYVNVSMSMHLVAACGTPLNKLAIRTIHHAMAERASCATLAFDQPDSRQRALLRPLTLLPTAPGRFRTLTPRVYPWDNHAAPNTRHHPRATADADSIRFAIALDLLTGEHSFDHLTDGLRGGDLHAANAVCLGGVARHRELSDAEHPSVARIALAAPSA